MAADRDQWRHEAITAKIEKNKANIAAFEAEGRARAAARAAPDDSRVAELEAEVERLTGIIAERDQTIIDLQAKLSRSVVAPPEPAVEPMLTVAASRAEAMDAMTNDKAVVRTIKGHGKHNSDCRILGDDVKAEYEAVLRTSDARMKAA
jgi:hypothetical protein